MLKNPTFTRRLLVYIFGLFLLSVGVVLSIQAGLGASPVSALPYALVLITPWSMGFMIVASNLVFIALQFVLGSKPSLKECAAQLATSLLFCGFIDAELHVIKDLLPVSTDYILRAAYLIISLIIIGFALLLYLPPKFSPLTYDALTYALAKRFNWEFAKAKIVCDSTVVLIAGLLGWVYFHNLGSVGIGTLIAATLVGRIAGALMQWFQPSVQRWIFKE